MLIDDNFLDGLNVSQAEAVLCTEGPLLVLAGAGTGKTKVLTTRIANIISQNLAQPQEILAVTFTNKAAKEMNERVSNMIPSVGLNIGTFHSISARLLRSHAEMLGIGLRSNFTIIDTDEQLKMIKNIIKENGIDFQHYAPKLIHVIISRWKDAGLLPNKINKHDIKLPVQRIAKLVYEQYQTQLNHANVVDFGDLLMYNNELFFNHAQLLEHYQQRYKYILIDEYQDTNGVQYVWARMLASGWKNICCVGDDDQSIYSWRGAEVGNILRFEKDFPNAKIIKLQENYRSSPEILLAASNLINHNKNRHDKRLWTGRGDGEKIKIVTCWSDREEARFVGSEIERLVAQSKYRAGNIAILVRAGFQTRAFEEVFISSALPYRIVGGLRFYERKEIRDILAYIRITLNSNDNMALERIINTPKRAIGNSTLTQIKEYAAGVSVSLLEAIRQMLDRKLLKGKVYEALSKLIDQFDVWALRYANEAAFSVTKAIVDESGYMEMLSLEKTEEARGRMENIGEMLKAIAEFDSIADFIEHSSLVMEHEDLENNFGGAINIMTLHAAKGLEFDLVFLPGWEEGVFPHQKAILEEGEKGLEEERRIAYVGLTRAKKEIYITKAESRRVFNEILNSLPSRFLAEIPDQVCIKTSSTRGLNYASSRPSFSSANQPRESYIGNRSAFNSYSSSVVADNSSSANNVRPGNKVKHAKFGSGIIIRVKDDSLDIVFENQPGVKTIKMGYVEML